MAAHGHGPAAFPPDKPSVTPFELVKDRVEAKLKEIFEEEKGAKKGDDSSSSSTSAPRSVQLVVDLYSECIDEPAREAVGIAPLKEIFSQAFGVNKWPILTPLEQEENEENNATFSSSNSTSDLQQQISPPSSTTSLDNFITTLTKLHLTSASNPLISFSIKPDEKATTGADRRKLVHVSDFGYTSCRKF